MNRRNFLAGLLATTAAVPLAKALPPLPVDHRTAVRQFRDEVIAAFEERQAAIAPVYAMQRFAMGFTVNDTVKSALGGSDFTRWGPEPGTVWYDEATDIEAAQWDVLRQILDSNVVPDADRVILSDGVTPLDS